MSWTLARRTLVALAILALLPYIVAPVYRWPAARPFTGLQLWNPYAQADGPWRRANFHAHGQTWGGVMAGAQPDADVVHAYQSAGYAIAEVSNYETISPLDLVPEYEHGYNVNKHHQLALGARAVLWWDFPFWQGLNEKQFVLDRLRESSELIALNHPARRHGYTVADVERLTGYDLMEIANGHITTGDRWDAALSSGRPVWGMGGDDTHDVTDAHRFAVAWTMVAAPELTADRVLDALRKGQDYVVVRKGEAPAVQDVVLSSLALEDSRLTIRLDGPESVVTFIGQNGRVLGTSRGRTASYEIAPGDSYVRTMVQGPAVDLYLNPVIRTPGGPPRWPQASVDPWWTVVRRVALGSVCALAAAVGMKGRRKVPGAPAPRETGR